MATRAGTAVAVFLCMFDDVGSGSGVAWILVRDGPVSLWNLLDLLIGNRPGAGGRVDRCLAGCFPDPDHGDVFGGDRLAHQLFR